MSRLFIACTPKERALIEHIAARYCDVKRYGAPTTAAALIHAVHVAHPLDLQALADLPIGLLVMEVNGFFFSFQPATSRFEDGFAPRFLQRRAA